MVVSTGTIWVTSAMNLQVRLFKSLAISLHSHALGGGFAVGVCVELKSPSKFLRPPGLQAGTCLLY